MIIKVLDTSLLMFPNIVVVVFGGGGEILVVPVDSSQNDLKLTQLWGVVMEYPVGMQWVPCTKLRMKLDTISRLAH